MRLAIISVTAVAALPIRYLEKHSWKDCVQLKAVPTDSSNIRPVSQVNYCHTQRRLYFRKPEDSRIVWYEIERHGKFKCDSRQCTFPGLKKQPESLSLYGSGESILSLFYLVPADGCYTVPAVGQAEIKAKFCLRAGRKLEVIIQKPEQCLEASKLDLQPTFVDVLSEPTAMKCINRKCKSKFSLNLVENEENEFKLTCGIDPDLGGRLELLFRFKPRELQPMDMINHI